MVTTSHGTASPIVLLWDELVRRSLVQFNALWFDGVESCLF